MNPRGGKLAREVAPPRACHADTSGALFANLSLWWTVGPGEGTPAIVDEQAEALRASGLLREADAVYVWARDYAKFSAGSPEYSPDALPRQAWFQRLFGHHRDLLGKLRPAPLGASAVQWWLERDRTYELPALEAAHGFCRTVADPGRHAIAYFHTKGSWKTKAWHGVDKNDWRRLMQHFVIRHYRSCLRHLACGSDTCGVRLFSERSRFMYSGNFWWARCDYVRRLVSPRPLANALARTEEFPKGRFLAEVWLLSGARGANGTSYHKSCWGMAFGELGRSVTCLTSLPEADQEC